MTAEVAFEHAGLRVRAWQADDREGAASIIATVLAEYGLHFDSATADRDAYAVEESYLQPGEGGFWVVENQAGALVGTAGLRPWSGRPGTAEVRKMYLLREARGRGLGRHLLAFLEAQARSLGYTRVMLETASVLEEAVALYESAGYRDTSEEIETRRCDRILVKPL